MKSGPNTTDTMRYAINARRRMSRMNSDADSQTFVPASLRSNDEARKNTFDFFDSHGAQFERRSIYLTMRKPGMLAGRGGEHEARGPLGRVPGELVA